MTSLWWAVEPSRARRISAATCGGSGFERPVVRRGGAPGRDRAPSSHEPSLSSSVRSQRSIGGGGPEGPRRSGRSATRSSRFLATSRAPRRATLPHFLASAGSGGRGSCVPPRDGLGPPPRPVGLRLAPVRGTPRCCPSEPPGRPGLLPPLRRSGTRPDRSSSRGRREPGVADRDPVRPRSPGPGRADRSAGGLPVRSAAPLRSVRSRPVTGRSGRGGLRPVPGRPAPGCPPLLGPFGPPRSVPARDRFEVGVSAAREDPLGRPGRPLAVPRGIRLPSRGAPPGRPLAPDRPGAPDRPVRLGRSDDPPVGRGARRSRGFGLRSTGRV